jgi:uncharacterized membrane protein
MMLPSPLILWLSNGLDAAYGNLPFMAWNTFLAVIPLILSLWLFRSRGAHDRHLPWWIGFVIFMLFLPNAPYVLTDIIHLIHDIRNDHSIWAITLILVPQYLFFMGIGCAAYVVSLVNLGRYLRREGKPSWVIPAELTTHALCALGIYLGRFLRFNSWDILTQPHTLAADTLDILMNKRPLAIMLVTFCVITSLYWVGKQLTLAFWLYWRTRHLRSSQRYFY